jgi:predicted Zn-dependent peptidase
MVLSVAGNTTHREVVDHARRLYGALEGAPPPAIDASRDGVATKPVVTEARDITQSNLAMAVRGLSRKDPARYALGILNAVLGRGMSSRLFREVRERRGLAYSIGSGVTRFQDTGLLSISAGVSAEKVSETVSVVKEELQKLVDEPVGDEEMTKARDYSIGTFRLSMESPMALAHRAGEDLLFLGEIEPIEAIVGRLQAVTADDVQQMAQRLFRTERMSMSLVGPGADEAEMTQLLAA